jgi:hypothetical protein
MTPSRPTALHLVGEPEVQTLRTALTFGVVPCDLQQKLAALHDEDLVEHGLRQKTLLFLALLAAVRDGEFRDVPPAQQQRLLRVVAYVRKDDDAIADTAQGGYTDDLAEARAAFCELADLLDRFTHWRLQHQVPALWRRIA